MTEIDDVRTELLKHGARFSVVKNTLTKRAAEAAGVEGLIEFLDGPTAIAFVGDADMVAVAKTLNDTARQTKILALKGGILDGQPITAEQARELASLPPADLLRGQMLAAVVGPLNAIVGLFTAPVRDLVGLIDARIRQLEAESPAEAPEEAPPAEPSEESAPETAPAEASEEPTSEVAAEEAPLDEEPAEATSSAEDQESGSADATEPAAAETQDAQETTDEEQEA